MSTDETEKYGFSPPLFKQRYNKVFEIIKTSNFKSIVDFGCAECNLLTQIKKLRHIDRIVGVDIDEDILSMSGYKITTRICDHTFKREHLLTVSLYQGDVSKYDSRLKGIEVATMVELIEHLEADELKNLPQALFGFLQPKLVIITTPNIEFNVVFGSPKELRHIDHKFEWTRNEFQAWCNKVCEDFEYSVTFDGVGDPPRQHENVGHCSQIAIFTRTSTTEVEVEEQFPYLLVKEQDYPVEPVWPLDIKIYNAVCYYITNRSYNNYIINTEREDVEDPTILFMSFNELLQSEPIKELCQDVTTLRNIIIEKGGDVYKVTPDGNSVTFRYECGESMDSGDEDDNVSLGSDGHKIDDILLGRETLLDLSESSEDNLGQFDDADNDYSCVIYDSEDNWD